MATKMATTPSGLVYRPSIEDQPPRSVAPSRLARNLTLVVLAFVLLYFLLPIVWLVIASSKNNPDLLASFGFWFSVDW